MQHGPLVTQLEMPTKMPTVKLIASQIAVFLVPLVLYFLQKYSPVPLPETAATFVDALVQSAIVSLIGLGVGYFKRPAARDVPVAVNDSTIPPTVVPVPPPPPDRGGIN